MWELRERPSGHSSENYQNSKPPSLEAWLSLVPCNNPTYKDLRWTRLSWEMSVKPWSARTRHAKPVSLPVFRSINPPPLSTRYLLNIGLCFRYEDNYVRIPIHSIKLIASGGSRRFRVYVQYSFLYLKYAKGSFFRKPIID